MIPGADYIEMWVTLTHLIYLTLSILKSLIFQSCIVVEWKSFFYDLAYGR